MNGLLMLGSLPASMLWILGVQILRISRFTKPHIGGESHPLSARSSRMWLKVFIMIPWLEWEISSNWKHAEWGSWKICAVSNHFRARLIVDRNLRLYIVLIGTAKRTGLFDANWRSTHSKNSRKQPEAIDYKAITRTLTTFTDTLTVVDGRGRSNTRLLRVLEETHKVVIKSCKVMRKEVEAEGGLESTYIN